MMQEKNELRKCIKDVRWLIFWVVLVQFAAEVVDGAVVSFMENPPHKYIRSAIIELITIGVPLTVYARYVWNNHSESVRKEFGLKNCDIHLLLLAAILGICGQFVMILLNLPLNMLFPREHTLSVAETLGGGQFLLGFVTVVIIPAFLEEFWMRGVVFSAYNKSNTVAAVFFTSLIFAFLHMSLHEAPGFLFMGIVASVVMLKCNSLYAAMVYHGFNNLTALLFRPVVMPIIAGNFWLFMGLAVILFVGLFGLLLMQKNKVKPNKHFNSGKLVMNSIFSLPMILSVAVAVIKAIVSA